MKIPRHFTSEGQDVLKSVEYENRTSRITNPDGTVVFEMKDAMIPRDWSQLAADIMVSKYFRKAGVPQTDPKTGKPLLDEKGAPVLGPEKSAGQVVHRLAGCWRHWGESHGYFDSAKDAQAFYDEIAHMLLKQMCAPNSPQWFNTGLNWAYHISGPAQGHYYCDPKTGEMKKSADAYTHPQPHACFIQSVSDDLVNEGGIMELWIREARLFKYGSGTGTNFSKLRGENEPLSGGGKSSGLMSFLKIGDRAAGAIKSGGTTRRAAKMVCLDLDHPDIEAFVNWKVREELKVACLAEGLKRLPKDQQALAQKLGLKLDYDFNGEAYQTVSGQNSNNSVRIPNAFFKAVEADSDWNLTSRSLKDKKTGKPKIHKTLKARGLWEQIAFAAWRCADPGVQFDDTINQWHTCPKSGRINASNPCVTGDTRILTPGGVWRRIDRMIHLPGRILTNHDGMRIGVTDGAFPTGVKEAFELQTASGFTLKLTADHKVWTANRGWVPAEQLTQSDLLKLPSQPACVEEIGQPRDPAFFQLLGLLVSRANGDLSSIHLDMTLKDSESLETLSKYVTENWAIAQNYDDDYANPAMVGHSDTLTLHVTQRRLLTRLHAFIVRGIGACTRIGDELFSAGLAAQRHFLRSLFTADGVLRNNSLEITGESSLLADVQTLLLGFGILSSRRSHIVGAKVTDDASPCSLRIDPGSLRVFARYIGLLPGVKYTRLASALDFALASDMSKGHFDRFLSLTPIGAQTVYDLTEPATHSFIAQGITIHNCSEYMFLDDTACNLASLNAMMFFDADSRRFDIGAWRHATRLWTIVLEISVLMASFPSESIAKQSFEFRTLGLGYANLGAMLMQAGIPYDSEKGRAICAALTSILTGESYATSAELANELSPFPKFAENREEMLRVIRNHRRAAYDVAHNAANRAGMGDYETLDIFPVGIDAAQFTDADPLASAKLLSAARECWDRALTMGEKSGYRNAQVSVIAPTGTIGLLMDCDTTGVEPDYALVKFKKLAGGGYFKIANQSLQPALKNLGYSTTQVSDILNYVMGTLSLENAPHINRVRLSALGFSADDLDRIDQALPGAFELSFAFSPWALGEETMKSLGIPETQWKTPGFNLLKKLGFTKHQIDEANDFICGHGTIEGAPHLRDEHLPVFDCANKCGKIGKRFIPANGHIRMMAAAQPFITGAISKTINLPNEATIDDIKSSYILSWQLGLKANALYRDGSKLSQPLNVKSDEDLDNAEEDDAENVESAKQALAADVAKATSQAVKVTSDNLTTPAPATTIEKIIERIVERPLRRRLPDTRRALTHKFDVQGHEGYITVGLYDDGNPGEVFITMAKEGSTIGGLMDTIATLVSVALQYGVPVDSLVRKFEHVRFEPSGMTRNADIPIAKSLVDYIFRWLAMEFIPGYKQANSPRRPEKKSEPATTTPAATAPAPGPSIAPAVAETLANLPADDTIRRPHAHGQDSPSDDSPLTMQTKVDFSSTATRLQQVIVPDPLSSQSSAMQADAPACDVCGSITMRSGTCYKCLNCGNSMGCS